VEEEDDGDEKAKVDEGEDCVSIGGASGGGASGGGVGCISIPVSSSRFVCNFLAAIRLVFS